MCRSVIRQRKLAWCVTLVAMMGTLSSTPAAPVPTHLMPPEPPLFPTRVGTKWVYAGADGESIHVITRVEKKGDEHRITIASSGAGDGLYAVWSLRPDGLFLLEGDPFFVGTNQACGGSWCLMKTSRKVDKWNVVGTIEGAGTINGTFRQVAVEEVKVPAGTFIATNIVWQQASTNLWQSPLKTYWYARGVGVVQVGDPPVWRLKSFELGK